MKNNETEKVILDIPANIKYLETISACLNAVLDRGPAPKVAHSRFAITLAVHEASVNIIEHAYHGRTGRIKVEIEVFSSSDKIVVELLDQGAAAELGHLSELNLAEPQTKGYGLVLINQLVDKVQYTREKGINRWKLVKIF